ncbi:MAG: polysaccharide biosynthesis C-terminal domain-containing protein [Candidatus Dadabacteria bacterium]
MFRSLLFKVIYTVIMFLATILLGNIVHPEQFGAISLLVLNTALFSLVTGIGADTMIMHMLGNNKWSIDEAVHFMWRTIALQFAFFFILEIGCIALFKMALLSAAKGLNFFFIDLIYFTGVVFVEKFIALFYSTHKATFVNMILSGIAITYLGLLAVFYFWLKVHLMVIIYSFAIQSLMQGIVLFFTFFSKYEFKGSAISNKEIAFFLRISSVVMITNIIQLLAYRVDFWIIKSYFSNYEVGIYTQANKFANLIWLVPNIVAQLLIPKYLFLQKEQLSKIFRLSFISNLLIVLATILITRMFYLYFLNSEYREGLSAFYLMLPGYFFWAMVIYFAGYFSWQGKFRYNLFGSMGCLLVILVTDFLLIPRFSYNGAAIANTVAYTIIFCYYVFMIIKSGTFSVKELFIPRRKDIQQIMILK